MLFDAVPLDTCFETPPLLQRNVDYPLHRIDKTRKIHLNTLTPQYRVGQVGLVGTELNNPGSTIWSPIFAITEGTAVVRGLGAILGVVPNSPIAQTGTITSG